jgi:hypothetical protein
MKGIATMVSERVESLLPRTAAAACVPYQVWFSLTSCNPGTGYCEYERSCHTSCYGKAVCGPWKSCGFPGCY